MSARYSLIFLLLSVAFVGAMAAAWNVGFWPAAGLVYMAFSFLIVSLAYAWFGPRLFLKRSDGRLHPFSWLLLGPYHGLLALSFGLYRLSSREAAYAQVAPNLFFGRRLTTREAQQARSLGWSAVLDLAGEFAEVGPLRRVRRYRSLPVLDATAPAEEQLRATAAWLREAVATGPVYVHCALGYGRTGTVVLAYLLAVGEVATIEEGLARLRAVRPGVALAPPQVWRLRKLERAPAKDDVQGTA